MDFTATDVWLEDGIGGTYNAADYHYVLFERQIDEQDADRKSVYFEFDDQIHGGVDCVTAVIITGDYASFELRDGQKILVRRGMAEPQWSEFLKGISDAFGNQIVHKA